MLKKQSSSRAHVMSHTWLDRAPFPLPHSTPSTPSLLDFPIKTNPCVPLQGLMFGRFAGQSLFTGYEPNALVVSSTEVTTVLLPSRKASIGSTCDSGLLYRRWMKDRVWECWPPNCQHRRGREREVRNPMQNLSLWKGRVLRFVHHTFLPVR